MKDLLQHFSSLSADNLVFPELGKIVRGFDFSKLEYQALITNASGDDYCRNILMMTPLELILISWPPGCASAIHEHDGFYGYVVVLEGQARDTSYQRRGQALIDERECLGTPFGIIPEPDGMIHRIENASSTDRLVTLHIYYPAMETLQGMKIYDLDQKRIGILSESASAASWVEEDGKFEEIQEHAFDYVPSKRSHRMVMMKPKPGESTIQAMVNRYYSEQADSYDQLDQEHPVRSAYTHRINTLIADELSQRQQLNSMLALALGTGRRIQSIQEASGRDFKIIGVEPNPDMSKEAAKRDIQIITQSWPHVKLEQTFDVACFLYSFGHIPTAQGRHQAVRKVYESLNPGGSFYLDVFNLHDEHEWGPLARRAFETEHLEMEGYELGDVFYRRSDLREIAFVHYFTEHEIVRLLEGVGFSIAWIKYIGYAYRSGEIVSNASEGFFVIHAQKP